MTESHNEPMEKDEEFKPSNHGDSDLNNLTGGRRRKGKGKTPKKGGGKGKRTKKTRKGKKVGGAKKSRKHKRRLPKH